jgi:hypothetical protein
MLIVSIISAIFILYFGTKIYRGRAQERQIEACELKLLAHTRCFRPAD